MYLPKYNSFFIHIPKTGGTSVEFYFLRDHGIQITLGNGHVSVYSASQEKYLIGKLSSSSVPLHHWAPEALNAFHLFAAAAYTFSIVRDPVERFKSECKFRQKTPKHILAESSYRTKSQYDYLYIKDKLQVDEVFRFEEWKQMESRLSEVFSKNIKLPHEQKSRDIQVNLTSAEEKEIRNRYARDFETFY